MFSIYLMLPTALGPGVHSAPNSNEYQKQKKNVVWGVERGCGILNISQTCRPSRRAFSIRITKDRTRASKAHTGAEPLHSVADSCPQVLKTSSSYFAVLWQLYRG
jgi:hypothetical protein